jgi:hypothetical protein
MMNCRKKGRIEGGGKDKQRKPGVTWTQFYVL